MKLKPNKHFSIQKSVLARTSSIIQILLSDRYIKFPELYHRFISKCTDADYKSFILALDLLFVLGKIEYFKDNDTIGLIIDEDK